MREGYTYTSVTTGAAAVPKTTFEQAFKIAQLMVDRTPVDSTDLKGFLALVAEIQKALDE